MNVLHLRSASSEKVSELDEFDEFVAHELASLGRFLDSSVCWTKFNFLNVLYPFTRCRR